MDCSDSQITQFSVPPTLNTTDVIEEVEFSEDSITITSSTTTTSPNQLLKTVTAKLIAQSEKAVMLVTPDYMKDDVTKFEFELIKLKPSSWPTGLHPDLDGSLKAFVQEFIMELSASQPIYELFSSLGREKTSFVPCQHMHE
ncbi:hypothetical protein EB796_019978 [Bugula neritina]|uniref:Uncharacterized protein n=1 Tax=Bugula neritina TaxID=10212 RepID=A0A7J7J6E3_BUGNE|nr:hypothetical protein EB796_019978 [Bugula neritina]